MSNYSIPNGTAVNYSPGNEGDLIFNEYVTGGRPVVRVRNAVLDIVLDCKYTVDAIGGKNILYESLEIRYVILLTLKINPVVELN
jgi:hypothetical protein